MITQQFNLNRSIQAHRFTSSCGALGCCYIIFHIDSQLMILIILFLARILHSVKDPVSHSRPHYEKQRVQLRCVVQSCSSSRLRCSRFIDFVKAICLACKSAICGAVRILMFPRGESSGQHFWRENTCVHSASKNGTITDLHSQN